MADPRNMHDFAAQLGIARTEPEQPEPQPDPERAHHDNDQTAAKAIADAGLPPEYVTFLEGVPANEIPQRVQKLQALTGQRPNTEPEHVRIARAALEHAAKVEHENAAEVAAIASTSKFHDNNLLQQLHSTTSPQGSLNQDEYWQKRTGRKDRDR